MRPCDLDSLPGYTGKAASFTSVTSAPSYGEETSRAASVTGVLMSVDEDAGTPDVGIGSPADFGAGEWFDEQSLFATQGTYPPPDEVLGHVFPSAPPSMVSGFSAREPAQPLTRQNSPCVDNDPAAAMMRVGSSQANSSRADDVRPHNSAATDLLAIGSKFSPDLPQHHLQPFPTAGMLLSSSMPASIPSFMQRTKSNASSRSRRPRPVRSRAASTSSTQTASASKTPYQRPKGPRVFCNQCEEHPGGFRGDHELRRHLKAQHNDVVKKYQCVDPLVTKGIVPGVQAMQPIEECKSCRAGKTYTIDYNAAAHLRRMHFKPKAVRGKAKGPDEESRAGKGGGDWPPMTELKHWLKEVYVGRNGESVADVSPSINAEDIAADDVPEMELDGPGGLGGPDDAECIDIGYEDGLELELVHDSPMEPFANPPPTSGHYISMAQVGYPGNPFGLTSGEGYDPALHGPVFYGHSENSWYMSN